MIEFMLKPVSEFTKIEDMMPFFFKKTRESSKVDIFCLFFINPGERLSKPGSYNGICLCFINPFPYKPGFKKPVLASGTLFKK